MNLRKIENTIFLVNKIMDYHDELSESDKAFSLGFLQGILAARELKGVNSKMSK